MTLRRKWLRHPSRSQNENGTIAKGNIAAVAVVAATVTVVIVVVVTLISQSLYPPAPPRGVRMEKKKKKKKRVKIISALQKEAEPEEIKLLETALAEDIVAVTHVPAIAAAQSVAKTAPKEKKVFLRRAAGKIWADTSLADWPDNDNRIFCGDLGNEVNDNTLAKVFVKYSSFSKAKVVRDKRTQKTKGYGFVSFLDPFDCAQALKEMQGAYVGNRPIKLRKSTWLKREHVPKNRPKNHLW